MNNSSNGINLSVLVKIQRALRQKNSEKDLYHYSGYFKSGVLTHVFATKDDVLIRGLENLKKALVVKIVGGKKDEEFYSTIKIVNGYLYDAETEHPVTLYRLDDEETKKGEDLPNVFHEYTFIIYDSGAPNLIYYKKCYYVIGQYARGLYTAISSVCPPKVITHLQEDGSIKRIFFIKHKDEETGNVKDLIIVLDGANNIKYVEANVTLQKIIYKVDKKTSDEEVMNKLYGRNWPNPESRTKELGFVCKGNAPQIYYLYGEDSLILKSYKGDYGEFILFAPLVQDKIDYSISFFNYEKVDSSSDLQILVDICKNDFENERHMISINNGFSFMRINREESSNYCCDHRSNL